MDTALHSVSTGITEQSIYLFKCELSALALVT